MTDTVAQFPAKARHHWNLEARIPACESPDGNDRTEKTCPICGICKITVHPPHGFPYRKWRTKKGIEVDFDSTPPCLVGL